MKRVLMAAVVAAAPLAAGAAGIPVVDTNAVIQWALQQGRDEIVRRIQERMASEVELTRWYAEMQDQRERDRIDAYRSTFGASQAGMPRPVYGTPWRAR